MKKLTAKLRARLERIARYRFIERRKRRNRRWVPPAARYVPPGEIIRAPAKIDLTRGSGIELVKFLRAIEARVLQHKQPVRLDFRHTESLYPAGTIRLYAEVDRLTSLSELPKPITILDPRFRRPREVLKQIGLHEITRDRCDVVPTREDVIYWKATKGKDQSGSVPGAMLEMVADKVSRHHARQLEVSGAWRGLSEAVANSVEHAYKKPRSDGFQGLPTTKWWMFTQLRNGIFTMAVCDLGCGYKATIDETLPERFIATIAEAFGARNRDCMAIHAAMEYGRSGTKQSERGKGSRDAMSVVDGNGGGELVILSNTGCNRYTYDRNAGWSHTCDELGLDIKGTVVWWKLPLQEISNAQN